MLGSPADIYVWYQQPALHYVGRSLGLEPFSGEHLMRSWELLEKCLRISVRQREFTLWVVKLSPWDSQTCLISPLFMAHPKLPSINLQAGGGGSYSAFPVSELLALVSPPIVTDSEDLWLWHLHWLNTSHITCQPLPRPTECRVRSWMWHFGVPWQKLCAAWESLDLVSAGGCQYQTFCTCGWRQAPKHKLASALAGLHPSSIPPVGEQKSVSAISHTSAPSFPKGICISAGQGILAKLKPWRK